MRGDHRTIGLVSLLTKDGTPHALVADRPAQPHVILRAAALDDDPGQQAAMHIVWTSHDGPWLTDEDGAPRFSAWPPDR